MAWIAVEGAADDMQHIAEEGILSFGDQHALRYTQKLLDMFDRLAALPYLAPERMAASGAVRVMPCGAHHILYVVENEDVIILRVLHGLQNWFDLL